MTLATQIILLATLTVWLLWEMVLVIGRARGRDWTTISIVGKAAAVRINSIPLLWGILAGHVFWPWPRESSPWFAGWWVWVAVVAGVVVLDVVFWRRDPETLTGWTRRLRRPGLWLLLGVALGHFTWPQRG